MAIAITSNTTIIKNPEPAVIVIIVNQSAQTVKGKNLPKSASRTAHPPIGITGLTKGLNHLSAGIHLPPIFVLPFHDLEGDYYYQDKFSEL